MSKQRLISDARRRARALSVETGRPYQSHLDDVARMTGRVDWKAFVSDPAPIPVEAPESAETARIEDVPPPGETAPRADRTSRGRKGVVAGLTAIVIIAVLAVLLWDAWSRSGRAGNMGAVYGEERQTVDRLDLDLTQVGWRKGRYYTVAKELPGERREVLVTVLDSRSASYSPLDWSYNHAKSYLYHRFGLKIGYVPASLAFYDHPLFRGRLLVSCRSGMARMIGGELADSFAGAPVRRIANDKPKVVTFGRGQTDALCAKSLLESSDRVRALWITNNSAEEYTYAWE